MSGRLKEKLKKKWCCVPVLLAASIFFVQAQDLTFVFHRLSVAEGLSSQKYNYYVYKDLQNFVWVSSMSGLNRFDSREVKQYWYDEKDSYSLAHNQIESMFFEDSQGSLWFSTTNAIHKYDHHEDRFYRYFPDLPFATTSSLGYQVLFFDKSDNRLWARYHDFICHFNPSTPDKFFPVDSIPQAYGRGIPMCSTAGGNGHFLLIPQRDGGQVRLYAGVKKLREWHFPAQKNKAFKTETFFMENDSTLWIGADTGLVRFDLAQTSLKVFGGNDFPVKKISGIVPFQMDESLVATKEDGLFIFDKKAGVFTGRVLSYESEKVLPFPNLIDQMYLDRDKVLWINSPGRGIFYTSLAKRKFKALLQNRFGEPADPSYVGSFDEDSQNRIWCLTKNGVYVLDSLGKEIKGLDIHHGPGCILSANDPIHIFVDDMERVWVANQSGLFFTDDPKKAFKPLPGPQDINGVKTRYIHSNQLRNGRLLITTLRSGILEVGGTKEQPVLRKIPEFGADSTGYMSIYEDRQNTVFLSRVWKELVICRQQANQLQVDTIIPLEPLVTSFVEDNKTECIWVGTIQGLYKLTRQASRFHLEPDTLFPYQAVNSILQDRNGSLWIGTNNGMVKYNPGGKCASFGIEDGVQALEFNFTAALQTSKGRFFFGGVNGINFFDPVHVDSVRTAARPTITNIWVNDGEPLPVGSIRCDYEVFPFIDKIELGYQYNTVRIQFAALEYSDPKSTRFRYYLSKSGNGSYGPPTDRNDVTYFDLREGTYQFYLVASNSDGVWAMDQPSVLSITILPPWYRSRLAYLAYALFVMGGFYAYYRFRIAQIRKEEVFKRKEVELKQQMAETETAILRLQMNPHFLFNSMNSINSYILKKDIDTASGYLNRFSRLMRMILDLAANPYVSVYEEAEMLELYINTEAMRFEEKFSHEIKVDDSIDPDDTILPTMILQPFVENAIWHGLSGKGSKGWVKVHFQQQDGNLVCSVEDNGIGRQAAKSSAAGTQGHESKALGITAKRLGLLEKETGKTARYEIIDLKNEKGEAVGTKVILTLPML